VEGILKTMGNGSVSGLAIAIFATGSVEAAVAPPPLTPEDGDAFNVYVADQAAYDSNLYRLPANFGNVSTLIAPDAARQDHINTVSLGGEGQWTFGRQALDLNLRADHNRFARNHALNNTSGDGNLTWNWRLGGHFSGQAGAEYRRSLASFAESRYLGRDIVDLTNYFGNARFQVGPRWALLGGIRETDTSHNAIAAQSNNFHNKSGNAGIEFATGVSDTFGLEYRYTDGRFPKGRTYPLQGALFNPDYHDATARFILNYAFTDKTLINAYAGHLKREYPNTTIGAFSGNIWRASLQWQPTGKTQLVFAGWRELHAYLASESDYFISKGGSVSPVWVASEKFTFSLAASLEDQRYIGSSPSALSLGSRVDKVTAGQANFHYTPRSAWIFDFFYRYEKRDSNQPEIIYDDKLATASVTFKFR
jgi:hypothetical protein